ncbi:MAG: hypothetical protein N3D16_08560 [Anaerolineales bacterium]|nr:hypothetical protein [Anaerolineales bacterium]
MRRLILVFSVALVLIGTIFGIFLTVSGQESDGTGDPVIVRQETQDGNIRQITSPNQSSPLAEDSPDIGFIDSPTATCYQPDAKQNICYINWYYLSVSATPSYMIAMTVTLNAIGNVAYTQGFFQTSLYIPHTMYDRGFKVECGALGSGGKPGLGRVYYYTIAAEDSGNLKTTNYGAVYCPAFIP